MATVYILYSKSIDRFYIGSTIDVILRLKQHNDPEFKLSFTQRAPDWVLFYTIENLAYHQARSIEKHIKAMKSKQYILNLTKYPEITGKLIEKFE